MSLRTFDHGTVMWTPLAGRIELGCTPSSSARTSSAHTPAAFTTHPACTSISVPSATTARRATWPAPSLRSSATLAWFTTVAPWAAAVRAIVSVSRASSVWAS